ncbi:MULTISPECIES: peptidoglycan-binding domain-containing protein [Actinomyces]|uniref:Peptidoglycan-binding protein n=1 Tax=Actinomyces respiraculi TaxID=2744574 RepID=A0A7T0LJJ3_9ACTO|nr:MULTISPECIES: peptidoglycan-binding domain-containing protein [Actinomyces]QPL04571.1 peptidoglycan-binding protein [Actinomyces respiraculi]
MSSERRRTVPRLLIAVLAVLVAVGLVAGTWAVARTIQSPAQRDAAAAPPSAAPVTTTVALGDLSDEITAMASVTSAHTLTVPLSLASSGRSVVTRTPVRAGEALSAGAAALWVNGRPVLALPGTFPAYRDLVQGDAGDDVAQLQRALIALGYSLTDDGQFGPVTADALSRLYRSLGCTAATVTRTSPTTPDQGSAAGTDSAAGSARGEDAGAASAPDGTGTQPGGTGGQSAGQAAQQTTLGALPMSEVVYIPALDTSSHTLAAVPAEGTVLSADTAVLTLASGQPQVVAEVPATVADALAPGATAMTTRDGQTITLRLRELNERPVDTSHQVAPGQQGVYTPAATWDLVFDQVDGEPLSATTGTPDTLLTIQRTVTLTDVLLVPKRAITQGLTENTGSVLRQEPDGSYTTVAVTVLGCVGGTCALDPGGEVAQGDELRIDGA